MSSTKFLTHLLRFRMSIRGLCATAGWYWSDLKWSSWTLLWIDFTITEPCRKSWFSLLWHHLSRSKRVILLQAGKAVSLGFPLGICWVRWGQRFFSSAWLHYSSYYCLKFFFCQVAPFLAGSLERKGFSWAHFCPCTLAFPGYWAFYTIQIFETERKIRELTIYWPSDLMVTNLSAFLSLPFRILC